MKWVYKNITIYIEEYDGKFYFIAPNKTKECYSSLEEAKNRIDNEYFYFNTGDFEALSKKLNTREREFIANIIEELEIHRNNTHCKIGLSDNLKFKWNYKK